MTPKRMPTTGGICCLLRGYGTNGVVVALVDRAMDDLGRRGVDRDTAVANGDREHIHWPRCRAGLDLAVAVVLRAVAGTIEAAGRLDGVQRGPGLVPRHGAPQVGA